MPRVSVAVLSSLPLHLGSPSTDPPLHRAPRCPSPLCHIEHRTHPPPPLLSTPHRSSAHHVKRSSDPPPLLSSTCDRLFTQKHADHSLYLCRCHCATLSDEASLPRRDWTETLPPHHSSLRTVYEPSLQLVHTSPSPSSLWAMTYGPELTQWQVKSFFYIFKFR
jgi:hypothetical protein